MIFLTIILSATLVLDVESFVDLTRFSHLRHLSPGYTPLIDGDFFNGRSVFSAFTDMLSLIILVVMIVMIRRAYTGRLNRLLRVAVPIPFALLIHCLLDNQIDTYIYERNFSGVLGIFSWTLLYAIPGYLIIGLILFLLIMLTCYPAGILMDKLLLYVTCRMSKRCADTVELK